eukprot:6214425-Pleurochrysis_carterae.AAC.1
MKETTQSAPDRGQQCVFLFKGARPIQRRDQVQGEPTHINRIGEALLKVVGAHSCNERVGGNITTNKDADNVIEIARVCGGLQQSVAPARYSDD